jgi:hypothetical protein
LRVRCDVIGNGRWILEKRGCVLLRPLTALKFSSHLRSSSPNSVNSVDKKEAARRLLLVALLKVFECSEIPIELFDVPGVRVFHGPIGDVSHRFVGHSCLASDFGPFALQGLESRDDSFLRGFIHSEP